MLFEQPIAVIARRVVFAIAREIKAIALGSNGMELNLLHVMSRTNPSAGSTPRGSDAGGHWLTANGQPTSSALSLLKGDCGSFGNPKLGNPGLGLDTRATRYLPMPASCPASFRVLSMRHLSANPIGG